MGDELKQALDKLDLVRVGEEAGLVFERLPSCGYGPCKDPFRPGDKHSSFQVVAEKGGSRAVGYVDYTKQLDPWKGGLWQFAKLCWPSESGGDLANRLMDLAGIDRSNTGGKMTRAERMKAQRARERKQRRDVEALASKQFEMPAPAVQPINPHKCVVGRWSNGQEPEYLGDADVERLCVERGWPLEWGEECRKMLSRPPLPWRDVGDAREERHWAFAVEAPAEPSRGDVDTRDLVMMGYHQRYYREKRKVWTFVPYMPRDGEAWLARPRKCKFQATYVKSALNMGIGWGERLVEPAPFAIGEKGEPRLVVIVEGQWDAITVYGALGGLNDGDPLPVLVLGLRGVSSAELMLAYWGRRLKWLADEGILKGVWLVGDSDTAGKALTQTKRQTGQVPQYAFSKRLQRMLGVRVVASWLKIEGVGKDFNDYWKAKAPSFASLWDFLVKCELVDGDR